MKISPCTLCQMSVPTVFRGKIWPTVFLYMPVHIHSRALFGQLVRTQMAQIIASQTQLYTV